MPAVESNRCDVPQGVVILDISVCERARVRTKPAHQTETQFVLLVVTRQQERESGEDRSFGDSEHCGAGGDDS